MISNKLGQGFLRFISILFLIFEQGIGKKLGQIFFKICKYTFCNIWQVHQHTIGLCFFNICKYTFFSISKTWSAKNWNWFFSRFVSTLFLIFEKANKQKIGPGFFWRFVSIPFLKVVSQKLGQVSFKVCKYTFFKGGNAKIGPGFF